MSPEELAAIEARVNAASAGPWEWDDDCTIEGGNGGAVCHIAEHKSFNTHARTGEWYSSADAKFIAAARVDVPALLAEVKRLQGELKSIAEAIRDEGSELELKAGVMFRLAERADAAARGER